ncbi:VrrA/YqfQ family protein [Bacillus swezeyi]|uniref:YqfQ-like protein n=1 Tax=Bacillus swezeyi TaxID=1925020 RepID=A0A1R1QS10_9BACI|nr:VrrA/YqfQ family protein [Bacillus swezeyi]MEC1261202.1 VrrA/YqfQ family protein [Bacillus swezeyi]MED2929327.1 VrrA/YqfQ family protein [Bacillus swezeyi]MED2963646.1 VrrA/YqfQ family protein [Bacillus swezeyi]MED3073648.1 VrrA/YqfQ family protein [Bacillus swezeyi]MED3081908.1 VrrA/YqfQ family protein [Bacillus swezeyi]
MFSQQPMRPRPPGPQRPSRTVLQRNPGMGVRQPHGQRQGFQPFLNQMGQAQQQAGTRGGGIQGLLSKFLPGGSAASGGTGAGLGGTGAGLGGTGSGLGGIQGLANPASLSSLLGNVQKALGVAQQVTPMIQQYGPLVRNLPGMVKMFRQLNSEDSETEDQEKEKDEPEVKAETSKKQEEKKESSKPEKDSLQTSGRSAPSPKQRKTGGSKPKLYI